MGFKKEEIPIVTYFYKCLKSNRTAATVGNPHRKYTHAHTLPNACAGPATTHGATLVLALLMALRVCFPGGTESSTGKGGVQGNFLF